MKGLRVTESHSADRAAQLKQKINKTETWTSAFKKDLDNERGLVAARFLDWLLLCIGCTDLLAVWLSPAQSALVIKAS